MSVERALEVRDLSVRRGALQVLRDVTFSVSRGESLAIIGPNGAGKTMLFRALIGAIPFTGTIAWAPWVRIGYVPQKLDLERDVPITPFDLVRARVALHGSSTTSQDTERALADVGIDLAVAHRTIGALSAGQFQRVLVAFALAGAPNVLLLDEPTSGVDEAGQERLNDLVQRRRQQQELTVLFISHDLNVVSRTATAVLCLSEARVRVGPPTEVLTPQVLQELYGGPVRYHIHER